MYKTLTMNLFILVLFACSEKKIQEKYDQKAIELNNKGTEYLKRAENDSALLFFDKAIRTDSLYYLPHANKTGIYIGSKEFGKALSESKLAIQKKPDYVEG